MTVLSIHWQYLILSRFGLNIHGTDGALTQWNRSVRIPWIIVVKDIKRPFYFTLDAWILRRRLTRINQKYQMGQFRQGIMSVTYKEVQSTSASYVSIAYLDHCCKYKQTRLAHAHWSVLEQGSNFNSPLFSTYVVQSKLDVITYSHSKVILFYTSIHSSSYHLLIYKQLWCNMQAML